MRTETLKWKEFLNGEIIPQDKKPDIKTGMIGGMSLYATTAPTKLVLASTVAATAADPWTQVWVSLLTIADWLCVGVITFAGATWMFGNRSRALEMLIGAASGYLIIRHAIDIKNWLSTI